MTKQPLGVIPIARVLQELSDDARANWATLKHPVAKQTVATMVAFLAKAAPKARFRLTRDPSFAKPWFAEVSLFRVLRRGNQETPEGALWEVVKTVSEVLAGHEAVRGDFEKSFGARLKFAMGARGYSIRELAETLNKPYGTVRHWTVMHAGHGIPMDLFERLAAVLEVNVGWLDGHGPTTLEFLGADIVRGVAAVKHVERRGRRRRSAKLVEGGSWV